jgi:hypothetical protein
MFYGKRAKNEKKTQHALAIARNNFSVLNKSYLG